MKNRLKSTVISLMLFVCILTASIVASADGGKTVEGVFINKPDITFVAKGDASTDDFKNVKVDDYKINIGKAEKYDIENQKVAIYVAVDISSSMYYEGDAIEPLKNSLKKLAATVGSDDSFFLYTMGNSTTKVLKGGESTSDVNNAIDNLYHTGEDSAICESLNVVYKDAAKNLDFDRKFVICISDGYDYYKDTTYETIKSLYKSHSLPLYSLILGNHDQTDERIKAFKEAVTLSGGAFETYNQTNAKAKFDVIKKKINNATVIRGAFDDGSNAYDESKTGCVLKFDGGSVESVAVRSNVEDDTAPSIKGDITYNKDTKSLEIKFSENIAVKESEISISKNGKNIPIESAKAVDDTLYIMPKDDFYSGEYEFNLAGVTDISREKNKIAQASQVKHIKAISLAVKILKKWWWVSLPIIFLIALYLVLVLAKRKKKVTTIKDIFTTQVEERVVEQHHTNYVRQQVYANPQPAAAPRRLSMYIEVAGIRQRADIDVVQPVFVGRSSQCDICIEDTKLSRQHFRIDLINGNFVVSDLNTTNGTFVNGTRVTARQLVRPGDRIEAGCSRFIIIQ